MSGRPEKGVGMAKRQQKATKQRPAAAGAARASSGAGRSGGVVDAAGKRHRQPTPLDPDASAVGSQAAKLRVAKTMVKTVRLRGRG